MGHKIPHCFKAITQDRRLFLAYKYKIIINLPFLLLGRSAGGSQVQVEPTEPQV